MKNQYDINEVAVLIEAFLHDFLQHLQKQKKLFAGEGRRRIDSIISIPAN